MGQGRKTIGEMYELKTRWEQRMHNPVFNEMKDSQQALEIGVDARLIKKWKAEASPAFWTNVAETIRNQYAEYAPEMDRALIREAQKGSLGHLELFYKRFEGWSPKQTNENINRNAEFEGKTDEELKAELVKGLSREELEKALLGKKAPTEVVGEKAVGS